MTIELSAISCDVQSFIDNCARRVGEYHAEDFDIRMSSAFRWDEPPIKSPIEQMLYTALICCRELTGIIHWDQHSHKDTPLHGFYGLDIQPQARHGIYRVDFHCTYADYAMSMKGKRNDLVVECDSQEFHERTERE